MSAKQHKPAQNAWMKIKDGVIAAFESVKIESCPKLLLFGSVARGDDCENSDIDLVVLTWFGFDMKTRHIVQQALEKANISCVPLHINFCTAGMEENILKDEGIVVCQ